MSPLPFHIVDVFAEEPYAGNQLAVVEEGRELVRADMQAIAHEMNYSETTFVRDPEPTAEGYRVRIFTPTDEIPFAGHPTLGTAFVIREYLCEDDPEEIRLDLDVGSIPVRVERGGETDRYWMTQRPPTFGAELDREAAAGIVGLEVDRLDPEFIPKIVSTGLPTLIVPLTSLEAVETVHVDRRAYRAFVDETDTKAVLVFSAETIDSHNDLHVRMFAEALGVAEDPATGSSNGCLAAYLAEYEYLGDPVLEARVEQGYALDRPSLLQLRADATGAEIEVEVGGRVIPVARGELL
ncbi:MAG: PhzF family phenazine biosynthesis protein [Halobacteriales archaeon]|nr:PhzF family phenazine biosynthesis protein [Halobacteriales archaeon]